jgi:hypothetical protein
MAEQSKLDQGLRQHRRAHESRWSAVNLSHSIRTLQGTLEVQLIVLMQEKKRSHHRQTSHRIDASNIVVDEPSQNLFSECLANIDQNVLSVSSVVMAVVYQERGVQPESKHG